MLDSINSLVLIRLLLLGIGIATVCIVSLMFFKKMLKTAVITLIVVAFILFGAIQLNLISLQKVLSFQDSLHEKIKEKAALPNNSQ